MWEEYWMIICLPGLVQQQLWNCLAICHLSWLNLHCSGTSSPDKKPLPYCGEGWSRLSFHTNQKRLSSGSPVQCVEQQTGKGRNEHRWSDTPQVVMKQLFNATSQGRVHVRFNFKVNWIYQERRNISPSDMFSVVFSWTIFDPGWSITINKEKEKASRCDFQFTSPFTLSQTSAVLCKLDCVKYIITRR